MTIHSDSEQLFDRLHDHATLVYVRLRRRRTSAATFASARRSTTLRLNVKLGQHHPAWVSEHWIGDIRRPQHRR